MTPNFIKIFRQNYKRVEIILLLQFHLQFVLHALTIFCMVFSFNLRTLYGHVYFYHLDLSLVTACSELALSLGAKVIGWQLYVRIFPNVFVTKCFVALNSSNNLATVLLLEGWLAYMRRNFQ